MALQNVTKILIGWSIATGLGIYAFVHSRKAITAKRVQDMHMKRRIKDSNVAN